MEVTAPAPLSEPLTGGPPEPTALKTASAALRAQADQRWVEISDRVIAKAMTATRRSPDRRNAHLRRHQGVQQSRDDIQRVDLRASPRLGRS